MKDNSIIRDILFIIFLNICWGIAVYVAYDKGKEVKKIIKDPYIIYNDMRIEKLEIKGMYGIISGKELKSFLNFKNTYEMIEIK